jgi:hypothetical protein
MHFHRHISTHLALEHENSISFMLTVSSLPIFSGSWKSDFVNMQMELRIS